MLWFELDNRGRDVGDSISLVSQPVILEILPEPVALHAVHQQPAVSEPLQALRAGLRNGVEHEVDLVDRRARHATVGLQAGGEQPLRELLGRHLVRDRHVGVHPVAHLLDALGQVFEPCAQGFEREERLRGPVRRHQVDQESVEHAVQFAGHQGYAEDRIFEALK